LLPRYDVNYWTYLREVSEKPNTTGRGITIPSQNQPIRDGFRNKITKEGRQTRLCCESTVARWFIFRSHNSKPACLQNRNLCGLESVQLWRCCLSFAWSQKKYNN
jgi:hypothetical protein